MDDIFNTMRDAKIRLDGLILNAGAGFDSKPFRLACEKQDIIANVAFNPIDSFFEYLKRQYLSSKSFAYILYMLSFSLPEEYSETTPNKSNCQILTLFFLILPIFARFLLYL